MSLAAIKIELEDWLRYNLLVRGVLAEWKMLRAGGVADEPQALARRINRLCAAARLAANPAQIRRIEARILQAVRLLGDRRIDWREFEPSAEKKVLENAAVLKPWVSEREKGVVYLSFEYQWPRLLQNCDVTEFARRYEVVLAPVWVSPYGLVNYLLPAQWPGPVFSHLSDPNDAAILPRMAPNYVVVPLLCSSWVNPDWYEPVPFEKKDIDIFMLANFGKYKRHFLLFKALRRLPRSTRVLLIGQHNAGRTRETLMAEARAYGVEGRFELEENATDAEVFSAFARAKTSLILSRREGSCIAVVESIMANTPVGLLANAEVGSRIFINEQTGRFLQEKNLAEQLADFIANAGKYSPRQWALANNIHCRGSSAILNEIIKRTVLAGGGQWTQDIAPFQWRPAPVPIKAEDKARLQAERREIYERFGIQIGREPLK